MGLKLKESLQTEGLYNEELVNSLTAVVAYLRPIFFELRSSLITFRIFVR